MKNHQSAAPIAAMSQGDLRFRAMADAAPVLIWETDQNGVIFLNRHYLEFFGADFDTVRAMGWAKFMHPDDAAGYEAAYREAFRHRKPYTYECRFRRADGTYRWLRNSGRPVDENRFVGCSVDVTDLQETQLALRVSEAHLQQILDTVATGVTRRSRDLRYLSANRAYAEIVGLPVNQIVGRPIVEVIGGEELEAIHPYIERVLRGETVEFEREVPFRTGGPSFLHMVYTPWRERDGTVSGWVASITDASDRKRAEMAWRRLAAVVEASSEFMGVLDLALLPVYVNAAGLRLVGLDGLEQACRTPMLEFFYPEDRVLVRDEFLPRVLREGRAEIEIRFRHFKTGALLWVIYSVVTLKDEQGTPIGYGVVTRDITNRRRVQEALRASETRYRSLIEATSAITWTCPPSGLQDKPQPAWMAFTGQSVEETLGEGWTKALHPDDAASTAASWASAVAQEVPFIVEFRIRRHDGQWRWMRTHAAPIRNEQGQVVEWSGMNIDIHEQRQAELSLRASDERFRLAVELTGVGTWDEDLQTGQSIWNAEAFRIFGRTPQAEPVTAQAWSTRVHPDDRPRVSEGHARARADGSLYECEHRILRLDGTVRWIAPYGRFILDASGRAQRFVGVFRDVTEQKENAEAQARLAYHDPLTQLPNRRLLRDRMQQALSLSSRHETLTALCYLDLDGFKPVNDTHGHEAGDRLLLEVARRLGREVRPHDTLARLGGDEFVLVLSDLKSASEAEAILARALHTMREPFPVGGDQRVTISASIGMALFPEDGTDPDLLLRRADQAMYQAKRRGRNQVCRVRPEDIAIP